MENSVVKGCTEIEYQHITRGGGGHIIQIGLFRKFQIRIRRCTICLHIFLNMTIPTTVMSAESVPVSQLFNFCIDKISSSYFFEKFLLLTWIRIRTKVPDTTERFGYFPIRIHNSAQQILQIKLFFPILYL
jgi:hypothetical protein